MSQASPPLAIDRFLCFGVYALNNAFGRLYGPLLEPLGLTYAQYLVMVVLWAQDGLTVGEIGGKLALESNTLTPLLKRLETAGLVIRRRSTEDERQVRIALSDKGRSLAEQAATIPACIAEACGLTMAELEDLRARLALVRQNIEDWQRRGAG